MTAKRFMMVTKGKATPAYRAVLLHDADTGRPGVVHIWGPKWDYHHAIKEALAKIRYVEVITYHWRPLRTNSVIRHKETTTVYVPVTEPGRWDKWLWLLMISAVVFTLGVAAATALRGSN